MSKAFVRSFAVAVTILSLLASALVVNLYRASLAKAASGFPPGFGPCSGTQCPPGGVYPAALGNGPIIYRDDSVNIFAGGDYAVSGSAAEAEGRVVVLGDFSQSKTSGGLVYDVGEAGVGSRVPPPDGTDFLAVGGNITIAPGQSLHAGVAVAGVVTYAGTLSGDVQASSVAQDPAAVAPYSSFRSTITSLSNCLASTAVTGSVVSQFGTTTFTGDGSSMLQVFDMPNNIGTTSAATGLAFEGIPAGATVIVNMSGAGEVVINTYTGGASHFGGFVAPTDPDNWRQTLLWNFPSATTATFSGPTQFQGAVLIGNTANVANVQMVGMNGRFYSAGSINHNPSTLGVEFHNYGFNGDLPPCGTTVYDLALAKIGPTAPVTGNGDNISWTVRVQNQGTENSAAFTVTDDVPAGLSVAGAPTFTTGGASGSSIGTPTVTGTDPLTIAFSDGTGLVPGGYVDITIPTTVTDVSAAPFRNWAEISDDSGADDDSTPDTNTGSGATLPNDTYSGIDDLATIATDGAPAGDEDDNDDATVTAAVVPTYSLGNRLWFDTGAGTADNGSYDSGEAPVVGATVELLDGSGNPIDPDGGGPLPALTATTDANGFYRFDNLAAGDYRVRVAASNFASGGSLDGYLSSTGQTTTFATADSNQDHGDDPAVPATSGVTSTTVTLGTADPTGEVDAGAIGQGANGPTGDASDNLTVDFGFVQPLDLTLTKSLTTTGTLLPGTAVSYTLTVTNLGPATAAAGWTVTDVLPAGLSYAATPGTSTAATCAAPSGATLTCTGSGSLAPNTPVTITVNATVGAGVAGNTVLKNVAYVSPAPAEVDELIPLAVPALTTDTASSVTNNDAEAQLTVGAQTYSLGNRVWLDTGAGTANDGILNGGEAGVDGVTVVLYAASGTGAPTGAPLGSATTANGGYYRFDGLAAGDYVVVVASSNFATGGPLADYTSSTGATASAGASDVDSLDHGVDTALATGTVDPGGIASGAVTLGSGLQPTGTDIDADPTNPAGEAPDAFSNRTVDFGFHQPLSLGDLVWIDTDHDGLQDPGEPGLDGVTVELLDSAGAVVAATVTATEAGRAGSYSFTGLDAGTYRVRFTLPDGYRWTAAGAGPDRADDSDPSFLTETDATVTTGPITLAAPVTDSNGNPLALTDPTIDAGVYRTFAVGDFVWRDLNADGVQDPLEPGVADVTVTLRDAGGTVVGTTTTDSAGHYSFDGLLPGSYSVSFTTLPAGATFTTQTAGTAALDSNPDATGVTALFVLDDTNPNLRAPVAADGTPLAALIDPTIDAGLVIPTNDLALSKALDPATPASPAVGDTVTFDLTVTNQGDQPVTAAGVVIADALPAGLTFAGPAGTWFTDETLTTAAVAGTTTGTVYAALPADLDAAGGPAPTATLTIEATIDAGQAGATLTNFAEIAADTLTPADLDSAPGNGTPTTPVEDDEAIATVTVASPVLDLTIDKALAAGEDGIASPGETVSFTVTVLNTSLANATGVVVTDTIPAGFEYDPALNTGNGWTETVVVDEGGTITAAVGSVPAGTTPALTLVLRVKTGAAPGQVTNVVDITAVNEPQDPTNDNADEPAEIVAPTEYDLEVAKSVDAAIVSPTDTVTYTITVRNTGNGASGEFTLSDVLPAGLTFDPATNTGWTITGQSASRTVSDLPVDDPGTTIAENEVSFTLVATVDATAAPADYTNHVQVATDQNGDPDSVAGNATAPTDSAEDDDAIATVTVQPQAAYDLALVKDVDVTIAQPGDTVTFTITVENQGNQTAIGGTITLTDAVPAGLTPVAGDAVAGTPWTIAGQSATVTLPADLAVGATLALTLQATVDADATAGDLTNVAEIIADGGDDGDSDPAVPAATTDQDDDDDAVVTIQRLDLALTKALAAGSPAIVVAGDPVDFTVTVTNEGNLDAAAGTVVVSDTLPAGLTFDPAGTGAGSWFNDAALTVAADGTAQTVYAGIASALTAAGGTATLALPATVDAGVAAVTLTNQAEIHDDGTPVDVDSTAGNGPQGTPEDDEDSAPVTIGTVAYDLGITKTVDDATPLEGATVTYTITVTNNSTLAATNVAVTDTLPAGVTIVDPQADPNWVAGVYTIPTLAAGATASFDLTATVDAGTAGQALTNTATITGFGDGHTGDDDPTNDTASVPVTPRAPVVDLAVVKTVAPAIAKVGDTVTYTVVVTNNGPADVVGATLTDPLPASLESPALVSCVEGAASTDCVPAFAFTANQLDGTVDLIAGETATISYRAVVAAGATFPVDNTATVAPPAGTTDSDPSNDSDPAQVLQDTSDYDLEVTKTVDAALVSPGDTVTYTVTVRNTGAAASGEFSVADVLPVGLSFDPAANAGWTLSGQTASTTVANLAIDDPATTTIAENEVVLTLVATVDAGATPADYVNHVQVQTDQGGDADSTAGDATPPTDSPDDDDAVALVTVQPQAAYDLSLVKDVDVATAQPGGTVTFTITVENQGNAAAAAGSITVTDTVPVGLTPLAGDALPGVPWTVTGQTVTVTIPTAIANEATPGAGGNTLALTLQATVDADAPAGDLANVAEITGDGGDDGDSDPAVPATTTDQDDDDDAVVTVVRHDLSLDKALTSAGPFVAGDTASFAVTVSNEGNVAVAAGSAVIADTLPAGLTFAGPAATWFTDPALTNAAVPGTTTGTIYAALPAALDPTGGAVTTATVALDTTIDQGVTGPLTNVAQIDTYQSTDSDSTPGNDAAGEDDQDSAILTVDAVAYDLSLVKDVDDPTPTEGDTVVYTITVSNLSTLQANNVVVTDVLPAGLTATTPQPDPNWDAAANTYTIGVFSAGSTVGITLFATVDAGTAGQALTNTATITGFGDGRTGDDDPTNDSDPALVTPLAQGVDLAVVKTVAPAIAKVGDTVTYTVVVTNNGPADVVGATVTDPLPASLESPALLSCVEGAGSADCAPAFAFTANQLDGTVDLIAGGTATISYRAVVAAGATFPVDNTATVAPPAGTTDSDPSNDSDPAQVLQDTSRYDLSLAKTVDSGAETQIVAPGGTATFEVTVTNDGNVDAGAGTIVIGDTLPAGLTFAGPAGTWFSDQALTVAATAADSVIFAAAPAVAAGATTAPISLTVTVAAGTAPGTTLTNGAEIVADGDADADSTPADGSTDQDDDDTADVVTPTAQFNLALDKTADVTSANPGGTIVYTITATNAGGVEAAAGTVTVTDTLPAGVTAVSGTPGVNDGWDLTDPAAPTFLLPGAIPVGGSATVDLTVTIDAAAAAGTNLHNLAEITGDGDTDVNSTPGNGENAGPDGTPEDDEGIAEVAVVAAPVNDLALDKVLDAATLPPTPAPGDTVAFTITVTNQGELPVTAAGVIIADTLPAGLTFAGPTGTWFTDASLTTAAVAGTSTGTIYAALPADLGLAGTATLTVQSTIDTGVSGTLTNRAEIWADALTPVDIDSDPGNGPQTTPEDDEDAASIAVAPPVLNLTIDKALAAGEDGAAKPGETVSFTITVANPSLVDATGVEITDTIPAGFEFDPALNTGNGWNETTVVDEGGTITNTLGAVPQGTTPAVTVVLRVKTGAAPAQVTNVVDITKVDQTQDTTDDQSDEPAQILPLDPQVDLTVVKSVAPVSVPAGGSVTYTVTVTNAGPQDAVDAVFDDSAPAGVSFGTWTCTATGAADCPATGTGDLVGVPVDVPVGDSVTFGIAATIDASVPTVTPGAVNTATITAPTGVTETDPTDNTDTAEVTRTPASDVVVTKTVTGGNDAGGPVSYTVTVVNQGTDGVLGATFTDTLPAAGFTLTGWSCAASGGATCSAAGPQSAAPVAATLDLPSDPTGLADVVTFTIDGTVPAGTAAGTAIVNTAQVTVPAGQPADVDPTNNEDQASSTVGALPEAELQITKTVDDSTVRPGQTVTFTLTATNNGPSDANGATVTDTFDAAFEALTVTTCPAGASCSVTGQTLTVSALDLAALAPGNVATITVTATVAAAAVLPTTNAAHIEPPLDVVDPIPANNDDEIPIDPVFDLALDKALMTAGTILPGDQISFDLTAVNEGGVDAPAGTVVVTDTLPAGLTAVTPVTGGVNDGWTVTGQQVSITLPGALAAGATSAPLTLTVTVDAGAAGQTLVNVAEIIGDGTPTDDDSIPGNDSTTEDDDDTASVIVGTPAYDLGITKTVDVAAPAEGATIAYTITVTNNSTLTATDVKVTDTLPAGVTAVDPQADPNWASGVYTIPTLAAGATASFQLTATVDAGTAGQTLTNTATITGFGDGPGGPRTGDDDPTNDTDDVPVTPPVGTPDLALEKTTTATGSQTPGSDVTFTISMSNVGDGALGADATVTDTLPAGLLFDPAKNVGNGWTAGAGTVTATVPAGLAPGDPAVTLALVLTIDRDAAAGSVLNTATVASPEDQNPTNDTDDAPVLVASYDLELDKASATTVAAAGDTVTYMLTLTNAGETGTLAGGVTVTDRFDPAELTFTAADNPGWTLVSPGVVAWQPAATAPAATSTATLKLVVAAGVTPSQVLENSAEITVDDGRDLDSTPANTSRTEDDDDAHDVTVPSATLDLAIDKTGPATAQVGSIFDFTITVSNASLVASGTSVVVTDTLPAGLLAADPDWTFTGQTGTITIPGPIAAGANVAVPLTVTVNASAVAGTPLTNTATITTFGDGATSDSVSTNNTDDHPVSPTAAPLPDVALTKTADPTSALPGTDVTFTLVVTNVGPIDVDSGDVTITDSIPTGFTFDPTRNTGWTLAAGVVTHVPAPGTTLAAGSGTLTKTLVLTVAATATPGPVTNTATVTVPGDSDQTNDDDDAQVTVLEPPKPSVAVAKALKAGQPATFAAGDPVTFTITVQNIGTIAVGAFTVTENIPAGLTLDDTDWTAAGTTSATTTVTGGLAAGATTTVDVTFTIATGAASPILNTVEIPGIYDGKNDQSIIDNLATASLTLAEPVVDVGIDKALAAGEDGQAQPGETVTFALTVTNNGDGPVSNLTVTDTIPAGFTFVAAGNTGWTLAGTTVTTTVAGPLASGATAALTLTLTVAGDATAGQVTNTAAVTPPSGDTVTTNNTSDEPATILDGPPEADLQVTKVADRAAAKPGDVVTYTVVVTNNGPDAVAGATVSDTLPASLTSAALVSCVGGTNCAITVTGNAVSGTINLVSGASATVTYRATVTAAATFPVDNTVTVTPPAGTTDPTPANNTATETVPKTPLPALALTKDVTPLVAQPGQEVTYTIAVTNSGTAAATGAKLTDTVDSRLTGLTVTCDPAAACTAGGFTGNTLDQTVDVAAGATVTLTLNGTVATGAATGTVPNTATVAHPDDTTTDDNDDDATFSIPAATPDVRVLKTVTPTAAKAGDKVTFTLTVVNDSTSAITGVTLTDAFPAQFTALTVTSCTSPAGLCTPTVTGQTVAVTGNLPAAGDTIVVKVEATLDPSTTATSLTNTASAPLTGDPTPPNNTATAVVTLIPAVPDLVVDKVLTAPLGLIRPGTQNVTFTITVENVGDGDAMAAEIVDHLPATLIDPAVTNCTPNCLGVFQITDRTVSATLDIPAGDTLTFVVTADVADDAAPGTVTNTATAVVPGDPTPPNNTDTVDVAITVATIDVGIDKALAAGEDGKALPGETIAFALTVTNNGLDPVSNLTVTDTIPAGFALAATGNDGWTATGATATRNVAGPIAPSATAALTLVLEVADDAAAAAVVNTAAVTPPEGDSVVDNNTSTEPATILNRLPTLALIKEVSPLVAQPGQLVTYTITVTNTGTGVATDAHVKDTVDSRLTGLTVVCAPVAACTAGGFTGNVLDQTANVAAGETVTLTVKGTVATGAAAGSVVNTATVEHPDDTTTDDNDDDATFTIPAATPDVRVLKTVDKATAKQGETVVFTLTMVNDSTSAVTEVTLTDTFPSQFGDLTIQSCDSPAGACLPVLTDETVSVTGNLPAAGDTIVVKVSAKVSGLATPGVVMNTASAPLTGDPTPTNNTATASVTIIPALDLALSKTLAAGEDGITTPGGTATFKLSVTNNGPGAATNIVLTDTLPAGMQFRASDQTAPGWSADGNDATRLVGSLAEDGEISFDLVVYVSPTVGNGQLVNVAKVASSETEVLLTNNFSNRPISVQVALATTSTTSTTTSTTSSTTSTTRATTSTAVTTRVTSPPASPVTVRGPLAVTGTSAVRLALLAMALFTAGLAWAVASRRRARR